VDSTPSAGPKVTRCASFPDDVSDKTLLAATTELEAQQADLQSSLSASSQDSCYMTPGQRQYPVSPEQCIPPNINNPQQDWPTLSQEETAHRDNLVEIAEKMSQERNENQVHAKMATDASEGKRYAQYNAFAMGTENLPAYGKRQIDGPALDIYVRVILTQPGDPVSKSIMNPHVQTAFRLHIPNNFIGPYYRNRQFITYLTNTAKSVAETTLPFPHFDMGHLKYMIEADSMYYNYMVNKAFYVHRLNINQLRAMDPVLRDEWLIINTPEPSPFLCSNGKVFHAAYEVVLMVHNIRPRRLQATQTTNESILVAGINSLIRERIDAVGTVAKILTLYHDYRLATTKPPGRLPRENEEYLQPTTPDMHFRAHPEPGAFNDIVITETTQYAAQGDSHLYVPPYRRTVQASESSTEEVHVQRTPSQERRYQQTLELMRNNYTSPYEERSAPAIKTKKRGRPHNVLVDPTTPWARTADLGTTPK